MAYPTIGAVDNFFNDRTQDSSLTRWPQATRYRLYTSAHRDFIRDTEMVRATSAVAVVGASISTDNAGLVSYTASTSTGYGLGDLPIYRVKAVYWDDRKLMPISHDQLDCRDEDWRTATSSDPTHYNLGVYGDSQMWLYPTPTSSATLRIDYIPMGTSFTATTDPLQVSSEWMEAIGYKALALAHEMETDSEMFAKGSYYLSLYQNLAMRAKNYVERQFGQQSPHSPYSHF